MIHIVRLSFFLILCFVCAPAFASAPEARAVGDGTGVSVTDGQGLAGGGSAAPREKVRQPAMEIWLPPEFQSTERKWPLLIFSHDFGGCAKDSAPWLSYLADQGYIAIAPSHADSNCRGRMAMARGGLDWPEKSFRTPEAWTDQTMVGRKDDVLFALSSMLDDRRYKKYVDLKRIGLIGHGVGGYTMLGLAGAWPSWKDRRFKAVLALSPYVAPHLKSGGIPRVDVPVMYQTGTLDKDKGRDVKRAYGAYERTDAPKYFIELDGARETVWSDLPQKFRSVIYKTSLQFLNRHVKGERIEILPEGADKSGRPVNGVKTFWKDEGVDKGLEN